MSYDKFLTTQNGNIKEEQAINSSSGAADADKIIRTNAAGQIDNTFLASVESAVMTAFETLAAGDFIHIRSDGQIEKADATAVGKEADGFVLQGITAASSGVVNFDGINTSVSGMTVGAMQFLDTTAGGITETAPSGSGNVVIKLGVAKTATELIFKPKQSIELA